MILQGNNLIVKLNGTAIAAAKTCTINVDVDTINVSSPTDGQWHHGVPGRKSWTVSTGNLLLAANASSTPLSDAIDRVGYTFTLSFEVRGLTADSKTGKAICKNFKTTGSIGNLIVGSYEWEGTGSLTSDTTPSSSEL